MLPDTLLNLPARKVSLGAGTVVLRRGVQADAVVHVVSGRVSLGLMDGDGLGHLLGTAVGPTWLEASAAILGRPGLIDAVADTPLVVRHLALDDFRAWIATLPESARTMLHDVASAHWQQAELSVSRLAKDAEARCAEWLLRHAQTSPQGALAVMLQQRKRLIAAQLGIAPETLSRVLRHLRERSLISGSGRIVNLVDPGGLRSLAGV